MGKKTIRAVRFLMALMNVRLGVWLENPDPRVAAPSARPRPSLLLKEMVGIARLSDPYIYVTDGGHFDNLGLVELLRRGCTTVFCLDGGGDPPGTFRALGEAVALSRSELQVDVSLDPSPIAPQQKTGVSQQGYALGALRFRTSPDGSEVDGDATGRIVYCRAAVTDDAPWDVRDFARRDRRFPNHSTMDQLFTDEKFESYRALGANTARQAVQAWRSQAVRAKVLAVLEGHARNRTWIRYEELVGEALPDLTAAELPSLRPLLDQLATEEETARRPPLVLLVQDDAPTQEVLTKLEAIYRYWAPLPPNGDDLGESHQLSIPVCFTGSRHEPDM
jgi:hypothetical protein